MQTVQQLMETGKPVEALAGLLQEESGRAPKPEQIVDICNGLVEEVYRAGIYQLALDFAGQIHTYATARLGPDHLQTLHSLNNLAFLYEAQGRYGEAEPLYQRALAARERVLGPDHPDTLSVQLNYAALFVNQEQPQKAVQQLKLLERRSLAFAGTQLHTTLQEQVRRQFLLSQSTLQDVIFTLAVQQPALAESQTLAADVVLRWKQVQRDEDAYLERLIRRSGDPLVQRLGQEIRALRRDLSHLTHTPQADPVVLQAKHRELEAKEIALTQHSRVYKKHLEVRGIQVADVRSHLPQGSALLELRVYNPFDFKTGKWEKLHWLALLLSNASGEEQAFTLYDLGAVAESRSLWDTLRQRDDREAAAQLYQHLFGALDSELQRFPTLYIAPDIFLHLVALGRLVLPDGRYWSERQTLRQIQTGRDLLPDDEAAPHGGLLALGGINYDAFAGVTTAMATPQQQDTHRQLVQTIGALQPLGHSGAEAEGVKAFYWDTYGGNADVWQGQQASESRLKALAEPPRVLHLATHGFYLPRPKEGTERPLTLSGLALAGANRGMQGHLNAQGDDGILYALEVQQLNLEGTELVTLSACGTGTGEVDYSDGVYGLVRAFRIAGARRVLMTLWPVNDAQAKTFMLRFYANWLTPKDSKQNPNYDPAIALQQTRLEFIQHHDEVWRKPRVWAPYVLVETRAGR